MEKDICKSYDHGFLMVPHKQSFTESLHVCKTLSGSLLTYTNKTAFEELIYYLSLSMNMKSQGCVEQSDESTKISVWGGGNDGIQEGLWETWNTREEIKVSIKNIIIFGSSVFFSIFLGPMPDHILVALITTALLLIQR